MNLLFCLVLLLSILISLIIRVDSQEFSVFKSYKDAKIKPKRYAAKIQRHHDVTEYLNENQLKMFKSRYSANQGGEVFDNNWSGYDKTSRVTAAGPRKRNKSGKIADPSNSITEGDNDASMERRLDGIVDSKFNTPLFEFFQLSYLQIGLFSCFILVMAAVMHLWHNHPKAAFKVQTV